ncbi:MAG: phosphoglycolate phosphatase [Thermoanaerobaculia bacterium]
MNVAGVAFDLDGTLVDSRRDLAAAANAARAELGLEPLPLASVTAMVGEGARNLMRRALGGESRGTDEPYAPHAADDPRLDLALASFLRHYDELCTRETRPYPGAVELLRAMAARAPLAVVTNKPERMTRKILVRFGMARALGAVVGGDTLPARKPDPAPLRQAARELGVEPERLLLVGDSRVDARTAQAAGAPFLFVAWGYAGEAERAELAARGPAVESVMELGRFLSRILGPPRKRSG